MQHNPSRRFATAALVAASTLIMASCGDPDDARSSGDTNDSVSSTTTAPLDSALPDQSVSSPPNIDLADPGADPGAIPGDPTPQLPQVPEEWIGLTEDEAQAKADDEGRVIRLVHPDTMLTEDFQPDRVNAKIADGKVVSVEFW